jgi:putative transposase/transposase-like zinc-binding protein
MCTQPHTGHGPGQQVEVADIFRTYGAAYQQRHRLSGGQRRVMQDVMACRTAVLGGQLAQCDHCSAQVIRYHSCQNRHCPKCQTLAKVRWVEARLRDLLPIPYFHCVFTLPHLLNPLAHGNPRVLYGLLFQTAAATLQTFGRDPKWLGGDLGITMVLHTWSQTLEHHIHVHCVVTGGALAPDEDRWIPTKRRDFLFPVQALSRVFRGKYLAALQEAYRQDRLQWAGATAPLGDARTFQRFLAPLWQQPWVVYAKPPFASAQHVLSYLGRYTHRVALSNDRLVAMRAGQVVFRWRERRHHNRPRVMTLSAEEFIRRFLLHVLPVGFTRIRHYGVVGNRCRTLKLAACRRLFAQPAPPVLPRESAAAVMRRLTGIDIACCPQCHQGRLVVIRTLPPLRRPALASETARPP